MGINLDLSKALHPSVVDVLMAFMPGFFFEICLLLANPTSVALLIRPPIDRPLAIVIAVIIAFVIGNVFMLWVAFVQIAILWSVNRRRDYQRSLDDGQERPDASEPDRYQATFQNCQKIAERVLKLYEIDPPGSDDEDAWMSWVGTIGVLRIEDFRGHIMVVGAQATGWSGLAAMYLAPPLRTSYFLVFCLLSIGLGLLDSLRIALELSSPEKSWRLGLSRAFEELQRVVPQQQQPKEKKQEEE